MPLARIAAIYVWKLFGLPAGRDLNRTFTPKSGRYELAGIRVLKETDSAPDAIAADRSNLGRDAV